VAASHFCLRTLASAFLFNGLPRFLGKAPICGKMEMGRHQDGPSFWRFSLPLLLSAEIDP